MPGPYPLATLAPVITQAGITAPSFADILASKIASYQQIYGADVSLDPSTQDGQAIAIEALGVYNNNQAIVANYLSYSPTYAQGAQLSSMVKINGLQRQAASSSTVPVSVVGQAGTRIAAGMFQDEFGNDWTLPPNVLIPNAGDITVTATCQVPGAVILAEGETTTPPSGTLTILTPQQGLQSITTTAAALPGEPVETDALLRQRQSISTGLPAQTPAQSILAAVANSAGVGRYAIYENDTGSTNGLGIPRNSISLVVEGGNATTIAQIIQAKKIPGGGTYGTTSVVVLDPSGIPVTIDFYFATEVQIYFTVTINPLGGYSANTGALIVAAIAAYIATLPLGSNVEYNKLYAAGNLSGTAALAVSGQSQGQLDVLSSTYEITALTVGTAPAPVGTVDIPLLFYDATQCPVANGSLTT
jgi:uncharacterized phage protein gp47/JayE